MDFDYGDIITATDRKESAGRHPIVYIEKLGSGDDFIGAMLTSSGRFKDNLEMEGCHFGGGFTPKNPQFIVKYRFVKPSSWGPYTKVGYLTSDGLRFIEDNLSNIEPLDFENYRLQ